MKNSIESPFEDADFIQVECPYCRTQIDFLDELLGTAQGCPSCGESMLIPRNPDKPTKQMPLPFDAGPIILRRFVADDWQALLEYFPDINEQEICRWLSNQESQRLTDEGAEILLGIERKQDVQIVGYFTLRFTEMTHKLATFQVVSQHADMSGPLFSEATAALFVLCFGELNLHRLIIHVLGEETERCQLLESVGMHKEAHFRKDHWAGKAWRDSCLFALLQEDYLEIMAARQR